MSERFRELVTDRAGRKRQLKTHGVTREFGVIDGLLSEAVNILRTGSVKSVSCSSASLQADRVKPQAFAKASPPCLLIYTPLKLLLASSASY